MKIGSLFSGTTGMEMALDGELAWVCDNVPAARKLLDYHYPEIKNLGDVKEVQWGKVPEVDIVTAGFPCQPVSLAGKALVKKMRDGFSRKSSGPFVFFDRDTSCWRMCQASLGEEPEEFSGRWPKSGMTQNGSAYELPMPERLINEKDGSLLPTPRVAAGGENPESWITRNVELAANRPKGASGIPLDVAVALLPTPTASAGKSQDNSLDKGRSAARASLPEVVRLLPTPNARDGKGRPSGWTKNPSASLPRSILDLTKQQSESGS